jgi:hypothetical protein
VSMCFDGGGAVLRGGWSCMPATAGCLAAGGKLEGTLTGADLDTSGPVEGNERVRHLHRAPFGRRSAGDVRAESVHRREGDGSLERGALSRPTLRRRLRRASQ